MTSSTFFPRALLFLAGLVLLAPCAEAAQTAVQWDYSQTTGFSGFKGYCAPTPGPWPSTPTFQTGPTVKQATVTYTGRVHCIVKAYDSIGESEPSNILTFIEKPSNLREVSQSVQFDPLLERVEMHARILDKTTGGLVSETSLLFEGASE